MRHGAGTFEACCASSKNMSYKRLFIEPIWHLTEPKLRYSKPSHPAPMPYSSDLTDEEWEILEPLLLQILPTKKPTRPSNWTKREIFNGILYQLKNGCNWCDLQARLATLLNSLLALAFSGEPQGCSSNWWASCMEKFASRTKKKTKWTTLIIIDSQAVKNTCNASVDSLMLLFLQSD